ncbi:hypothetical protein CAI21_04940 [Alkalilimnicola ehrlichii]|uniref:DUF481 domain-containing protein n=1 Tax=Alkalilimnicola ehrlichii TaxID=351052 RepID=A0A3E0WYU9_9GAMM|nr:hypothetical protein [Alkalilimnicola ehrlichii]RFA30425.1 hypothetical protein CAI21_04940 [Alkalilimnicola ehrlichii]RFA37978.1 hypothetical protein CAL65_06315 [Alkalilimnicola ehrlichii]
MKTYRACSLGCLVGVWLVIWPVVGAAWLDNRERPDTAEVVDKVHRQVATEVVVLGRQLDSLFGHDEFPADDAGSLLRLGGTVLVGEGDEDFQSLARFRLAVPRTEQRWNIFLESETEDLFDGRRHDGRGETGRGRPREQGAVAGLQFLHDFAEVWNFDVDLGVRVRWPLDPYTRVRVRRSFPLATWELRLGQSLFWYERTGSGTSSEMRWQREVGTGRLLRSLSEITWLDREQQFYYKQDLLVSQRLQADRGVVYQVGVRGESEPNHQVDHYFVNARLRRNVWRQWLFVELQPELMFARENDFAVERRVFVTLEAVFGDLRALD